MLATGPEAATTEEEPSTVHQTRDPSSLFIEDSELTYIVPAESELELSEKFRPANGSQSSVDSLPQRTALFFDETVHVLLVLKSLWLSEEQLRAQLRRLAISLQARVVNTGLSGRDAIPAEETIFFGQVKNVADALVVVATGNEEIEGGRGSDKANTKNPIYAVWKLPVLLARPRTRPHAPSVIFSASAAVSLDDDVAATHPVASGAGSGTGYLQSGFPTSLNLLESFARDAALGGVVPRLSASRIARVAPRMKKQDVTAHLRVLKHLKVPVFPAMNTRIRFSRPNTAPPSPAVVALLEIDFTPHFESEIVLDAITLRTNDGAVESLNDEVALRLPLSCVSHDHVTFLYLVRPHQPDSSHRALSSSLDISISASIQIAPGVLTPQLSMSWTAALDFTTPVNPSYATSVETGIQRAHRYSQLSFGSTSSSTPVKSQSTVHPDFLPALDALVPRTETAVPDLGITMSFVAPSQPVRPGELFSWTVYVVNRSSERTSRLPRKLALVAIPKRRRNEVRPVRPPSTASRRRGEKAVADAVLDENVLHAMQKNALVDAIDFLCLSADTRVGALGPGACHVVELQFLALRPGTDGLEAIRVMDLISQEHVDVRDLPTIIVAPATA